MTKTEITALHKFYQNMKALREAFNNLSECWDNPEVSHFMDDNNEEYPFDRSFDEMCMLVQEWYYMTGGNIQIALAAEELNNKLIEFDLTDGERYAVCEKLLNKYKEA